MRALVALLLLPLLAVPQEREPRPVVAQKELGDMACGPVAFYNALLWGGPEYAAAIRRFPGDTPLERIKALIDVYGRKPSEEYGDGRPRYGKDAGMSWRDLLGFATDILADRGLDPVEGGYLDRGRGEDPATHVVRIHGMLRRSLAAGFPPVVSFRSFEARQAGDKFLWEGLLGHWVTIVDLPATLADGEKGFRFGYADPATGKVEYGYAAVDEARNFTAARGNAVKWDWVTDRPFVLVTAPSLRLKTQDVPWYARTLITLNYAVRRAS